MLYDLAIDEELEEMGRRRCVKSMECARDSGFA